IIPGNAAPQNTFVPSSSIYDPGESQYEYGSSGPPTGYDSSESPSEIVKYGTKGSIRVDIVLRDPADENKILAIYDLKTGVAIWTPARVKKFLDTIAPNGGVFVIELRYREGQALDRTPSGRAPDYP